MIARLPAAALLLSCAALLATSVPLGWGGTDLPDGTRIKVSPIRASHVLHPDRPVSGTRDCGILPSAAAPCSSVAPAIGWLRATAPLTLVASLGSLLAAVGLLLRRRWAPWAGASLGAALAAPLVFGLAAPRALTALVGTEFGVGGTRGTLQIAVAAGLLGGMLALSSRRPTPGLAGAAVGAPIAAFLLMFPPGGALLFAGSALAVGAAAGWAARRTTP